MARFIPDIALDEITHGSERIVYEALRGLPDEFVVMHSFPWLRLERDLKAHAQREGEADFVILHPRRGLLVLEVKGGKPEFVERTWYRSLSLMKNPFDQARNSRFVLLHELEIRTKKLIHRGLFTHGDLIVFPHCRFDGQLPLDINRRIIVDSPSISFLPARVEEAFTLWAGTKQTNLNPAQFTLILDTLAPKLQAQQSEAAQLHSESSRIIQLTSAQTDALEGLLASKRVLVDGNAGSGKTLLALEFALTLAGRGEHVLFLCFNKQLSAWLEEQSKADKKSRYSRDRLEFSTFHSYAINLARRADLQFTKPSDQTPEFWDTEAPLLIERAVERLRAKGTFSFFDAIIIDEAQDFAPAWWKPIESLSQAKGSSRLYVFLDMKQCLREEAALPPIEFTTCFPLKTNCRNTKAIARSGAALAKLEVRLNPDLPSGEAPKLLLAKTRTDEVKFVLNELRQLLKFDIKPHQIALIGPASRAKGSLRHIADVDGVPLIDDASKWRLNEGILVTTTRSFKGLEADVVIMYGLRSFDKKYFSQTDLYVAWTRARLRLVLICQPGAVYDTILAALVAGESESAIANYEGVIPM